MRRLYLYDGLGLYVFCGKNPMAAHSPSPIPAVVSNFPHLCHGIFVIDEADVAPHQVFQSIPAQCHRQIFWDLGCNQVCCLADFNPPLLRFDEDWQDVGGLGQVRERGEIGKGVGQERPLLHPHCKIDAVVHRSQCLVVPDFLWAAHAGGNVLVIGPLGRKHGRAGITPEDHVCVYYGRLFKKDHIYGIYCECKECTSLKICWCSRGKKYFLKV